MQFTIEPTNMTNCQIQDKGGFKDFPKKAMCWEIAEEYRHCNGFSSKKKKTISKSFHPSLKDNRERSLEANYKPQIT